jgi:hypothetical protein
MDLLAKLIVDEVHLFPFPSLALVHQVLRMHLVVSLLLFPCSSARPRSHRRRAAVLTL